MFKKAMHLLLTMSIIAVATVCSGCTIGVKEIRETVMVSPVPIPESALGAIMIRTNKKIPLIIADMNDGHVTRGNGFVFEKNVGGCVIVDPWFYDILIESYKAQRAQ